MQLRGAGTARNYVVEVKHGGDGACRVTERWSAYVRRGVTVRG